MAIVTGNGSSRMRRGTSGDDTIIGSSGADTLLGGGGTDLIDLHADTDLEATLIATVWVGAVEEIEGDTGADTVTLLAALVGGRIDLGDGADSLTLADGGNTVTVANVESLASGSGGDTVRLGVGMSASRIDLGAGADTLALGITTSATLTVPNAETILGNAGTDRIVLTEAAVAALIDLGASNDSLSLASGADTLSLTATQGFTLILSNVETLAGNAGDDTVVLRTALNGGVFDLGDGIDALTLAAGGNTATVRYFALLKNVQTSTLVHSNFSAAFLYQAP